MLKTFAGCAVQQERRPRFDGPACTQPTRFGPGYNSYITPPTSPAFARRPTAHGSLCLYPEDTPDGVIPIIAEKPPIVFPERPASREPVMVRDLSAERSGLRLPNGSRLRVSRVNIFLSEEPVPDAHAADNIAADRAAADEQPGDALGDFAKPGQEAVAGVGSGLDVPIAEVANREQSDELTKKAERGIEMRDLLNRVAAAEAAIARHHSQSLCIDVAVEDMVTDGQVPGRQAALLTPAASPQDGNSNLAKIEGQDASEASATPASYARAETPVAGIVLHGGVPPVSGCGDSTTPLITPAAAALPSAIDAPTLWGQLVRPPSPFGDREAQAAAAFPYSMAHMNGSDAAMAGG